MNLGEIGNYQLLRLVWVPDLPVINHSINFVREKLDQMSQSFRLNFQLCLQADVSVKHSKLKLFIDFGELHVKDLLAEIDHQLLIDQHLLVLLVG